MNSIPTLILSQAGAYMSMPSLLHKFENFI